MPLYGPRSIPTWMAVPLNRMLATAPVVCDEEVQPWEKLGDAPLLQPNSRAGVTRVPPAEETPSTTTSVPVAALVPLAPRTTTSSRCGPAASPVTVTGTL